LDNQRLGKAIPLRQHFLPRSISLPRPFVTRGKKQRFALPSIIPAASGNAAKPTQALLQAKVPSTW
jgi:hypothetical protein